MKAWLTYLSEQTIVAIDFVALSTVIWATMEVCAAILWNGIVNRSNFVLRAIWLRYARWLVAALSLQLAADIIETSISTNWETIGKVGSIAVIRTFLNYFLDRDADAVSVRQHERGLEPLATGSKTPPH
jgi:uncharacterized membrane protein